MRPASAIAAAVTDALDDHDLNRLAALHHSHARISFAGIARTLTLDDWIAILSRMLTALPDLTVQPLTLVGDDNMAIIEMRMAGTNTGPIVTNDWDRRVLSTDQPTLPPTGRSLEVTGVVVMNVAADHVTSTRLHFPNAWFHTGVGLVSVDPRPVNLPVRSAAADGFGS